MSDQPALDQAKMDAFVHKMLGDTSATLTTTLAVLGDRLGLFKDLAAHSPATSDELAARMGMNERYAREWLGGMASAGYLEYEPATRRFTLPPEHAPALAQEGGPVFFGGIYQELSAVWGCSTNSRSPSVRGRGATIGVQRPYVGRFRALYQPVVREPPHATVAASHTRRAG